MLAALSFLLVSPPRKSPEDFRRAKAFPIECYLPYEQGVTVSSLETLAGWLQGLDWLTLSSRPGRRFRARLTDAVTMTPLMEGFEDRIFALSFWADPFAYELVPTVRTETVPFTLTDVTDVIARVMPIGKTHKDKPLYLTAGTYNINGVTVTVGAGERWVTSERAGDYPSPQLTVLETNVKAKSGSSADVHAAHRKMIELALNMFTIDEVDQPAVNVRVEFLKLGDTIEYEQYRRLEDVFLCDRVRVRHPGIGVDVLTEVIETVWDCLSGRFKAIELGRVHLARERLSVPVWQLPQNIPGTLVAAGTLDGGAFTDGAGAALTLTGNPATWQVLVMADRATETVGEPQEPTTLTAEVLAGGVPITDEIDAARFIWTRDTGEGAADAAWNAAHAGTKTVSLSAAERKLAAKYTCAIEAEPGEEAA